MPILQIFQNNNLIKLLAIAFIVLPTQVSVQAQEPTDQEVLDKEDRYVGYYYPKPQKIETYNLRITPLTNATSRTRLAFVTGMAKGLNKRDSSPDFAIFAKSLNSDRMIITSLDDSRLNTIYRLRAQLANLTSLARLSKVFSDQPVDNLTFLDLIGLLGFQSLVITDGNKIANRFNLVPPK